MLASGRSRIGRWKKLDNLKSDLNHIHDDIHEMKEINDLDEMKKKIEEVDEHIHSVSDDIEVLGIPLSMLSPGEEGKIVNILGGKGIVRRLSEMGFSIGEKIQVINSARGPVVVKIKDSRLALGRGLAMGIIIKRD